MKKTTIFVLLVAIIGALGLSACEPGSPPATKPAGPSVPLALLTGTVTYLQRIALPPSAVVEVQMQDVSLADAPATVITSRTIETQGRQVPIAYRLIYDSTQIQANHTYSVRATIKDGDKLLFASTQAYPVITNGAPTRNVEIMVEPVP